jgi:glycosyltransferase involved in cell wall biosynthesis
MNLLVSMYGFEVYVLTTDQGNHSIPYLLDERVDWEDLGIRIHRQYSYSGIKRLFVAQKKHRIFKRKISERIRTIRPDIIVCNTANYADLNILVKTKGDIPLIIESHNILRYTLRNKSIKEKYATLMYLRSLKKAQTIVALTNGDALEWGKIFPHVIKIPNVVHLNEGAYSTLDSKQVIFVGRLDSQKRPMDMIRIWQLVYPMFPDWHLHIYGEGELQQKIEDTANSLDMNIHIHQPTDKIFECYRKSSILVSTSLFEPFGLVIPEAMSCGLPVVACDVPYGPSEIITDGHNGFLVANNDVQVFADKMCELMSNVSLRQRMGKAAIASSQRYSAEIIMPMWKTLFEKVISPRE